MTVNRQGLCVSKLSLVLLMAFGPLGCEQPSENSLTGCSSFELHECEGACMLQNGICVEIQDQSLIAYQTQQDCTAAGFGWDWRPDITYRCYPLKQTKGPKQCRDRAPTQCTSNVGCVLVGNVCTNATVKAPCKQTTQDGCEAQGDKCLWGDDHCYNAPVGKPSTVRPAAIAAPRVISRDGTGGPAAKLFKCVLEPGVDREALCKARTNIKDCNKKIDEQKLCRYKAEKPEKCGQIANLCQEASKASWRTSYVRAIIGANTPSGIWSSPEQQEFFCRTATVRLSAGGTLNATVVPAGGGAAVAFPIRVGAAGTPLVQQQPELCSWSAAAGGNCEPRLQQDICDEYYKANPPAVGAARRDQCEQGDTGEMLLQRNPNIMPNLAGLRNSVSAEANDLPPGLVSPGNPPLPAANTVIDFSSFLGAGIKIFQYTPPVPAIC